LNQVRTKRLSCQVRCETKNPCLNRAVVEIRGLPFCGACAREQEAYFAIGEFTWEAQDPGSDPTGKTFGETLEGIRRQRANGRAQQTGKLPVPR
jgi:hypothetical protein